MRKAFTGGRLTRCFYKLLFAIDMRYDKCFNALARLNAYHISYRNCEAGTLHTATNKSNVVATYA